MAVLIVCKAVTVWTQVIFTMLVSNRVSCTKPGWLCRTHRINTHTHTHKVIHLKHTSTHLYTIKVHTDWTYTCWELHSITIKSTQRQQGTARCKGQKSQHLHGKVKGRAWNNPPSLCHGHHSPTICCTVLPPSCDWITQSDVMNKLNQTGGWQCRLSHL